MVQSIKSTKLAHLEQENERPPSPEELAEVLDMSEEDIKESMKNSGRHLSMDAPLVEGKILTYMTFYVLVNHQVQIKT